jgi:hypothetical protein
MQENGDGLAPDSAPTTPGRHPQSTAAHPPAHPPTPDGTLDGPLDRALADALRAATEAGAWAAVAELARTIRERGLK